MIFPKVTTSPKEFIEHVLYICEAYDIEKEREEKWVKHIEDSVKRGSEALYFYDMVYVKRLSPYLFAHEIIHHISKFLRESTQSYSWLLLDVLVDVLDILIFRKRKVHIHYGIIDNNEFKQKGNITVVLKSINGSCKGDCSLDYAKENMKFYAENLESKETLCFSSEKEVKEFCKLRNHQKRRYWLFWKKREYWIWGIVIGEYEE